MHSSTPTLFLSLSRALSWQVNQQRGLRLSAHGAFLRPLMDTASPSFRANLHVASGYHVQKLDISLAANRATANGAGGASATGDAAAEGAAAPGHGALGGGGATVAVCRGVVIRDPAAPGGQRLVRAAREVILAAGAVGSPHLLQCSGVGDGGSLAAHGVTPVVELPGVGTNLHDHLQIRAAYRLNQKSVTLNHWTKAGSLPGQVRAGGHCCDALCVGRTQLPPAPNRNSRAQRSPLVSPLVPTPRAHAHRRCWASSTSCGGPAP